jgi:hypothetical protein
VNLDYFNPEDYRGYNLMPTSRLVWDKRTNRAVSPTMLRGVPYFKLRHNDGTTRSLDAREIFGEDYTPKGKDKLVDYSLEAFEGRYTFKNGRVYHKRLERVVYPVLKGDHWYYQLSRDVDGGRVYVPVAAVQKKTKWCPIRQLWRVCEPNGVKLEDDKSKYWDQFPDYEFLDGKVWRVTAKHAITEPIEVKLWNGVYVMTDFEGVEKHKTPKDLELFL